MSKHTNSGRDLLPMRTWLSRPLSTDVAAALTRLRRAPDVVRIAVMPDVHLATQVCVGVVMATRLLVYPQAVGSDIGCGITALPLDADASALRNPETARVALAALQRSVPILRHRSLREAPVWPPELDTISLSDPSLARRAARDGAIEFATLGRGNHFFEIQAEASGRLWLTVHSGSRAMGQIITAFHTERATRVLGGFRYLDTSNEKGAAYLHDVSWTVRYAEASRNTMLDLAAQTLDRTLGMKARNAGRFGTTHNDVRRELHFGEELLVHRKGASPADEGVPAIIPGSMGSNTYHVTGRGAAESLRSSSHGAGRKLSRTESRRRISARALMEQTKGVMYDVRLSCQLTEEAPDAYRSIEKVMRAQKALVCIDRVLRPLVCHKGV